MKYTEEEHLWFQQHIAGAKEGEMAGFLGLKELMSRRTSDDPNGYYNIEVPADARMCCLNTFLTGRGYTMVPGTGKVMYETVAGTTADRGSFVPENAKSNDPMVEVHGQLTNEKGELMYAVVGTFKVPILDYRTMINLGTK